LQLRAIAALVRNTRGKHPMDFSKLKTVKVEREDGITWVILNRPEKDKRVCLD
jgi:hypothetical protein